MALAPQPHVRAASGLERNLRVMHRNLERPNTPIEQSASAGPAVEDHGRVVTANTLAADSGTGERPRNGLVCPERSPVYVLHVESTRTQGP